MSNLNLSRSEAIRLNREMWNWIADELEKIASGVRGHYEVYELKEEFCRENGFDDIPHYCFCCEYDDNRYLQINKENNLPISDCFFCPIKWGTENNNLDSHFCCDEQRDDNNGLWLLCQECTEQEVNDYFKASQYAKQIAELPERDVNADFAALIAEDRGILDYKLKGNRMIYYTNWKETQDKDVTYKVTIRLDTLKEERQKLNRYYEKGNINGCL